MASPQAAPRAWPQCRSPVGLAETHSTRMCPPSPELFWPKLSPASSTWLIRADSAPLFSLKLMKPGRATVTDSASGKSSWSFSARGWAMSMGLLCRALASFMAAPVA